MKKLIIFAAIAFMVSFAACSKICSCTEKGKNQTLEDFDLKTQSTYKDCTEFQEALNSKVETHNWECISK